MKIDDTLPKIANTVTSAIDKGSRKKSEPTPAAVDSAPAKKSDNVTLSPMSSQLQSLEAKIATDNVFDAQRVDSIKAAISNGTFKIDASKVADGLINTAKDLVSANKL